MRRIWGFTLIEMMITIVVLAILIAVAVPGMLGMIERNSVVAESNELIAALLLTRSEAIKREVNTVLVSSASGWRIFVDTNGDGTEDTGEEVLGIHTVNSSNVTLSANGAAVSGIRYGSNGRVIGGGFTGGGTDFFKVVRGSAPTRCVRFSLTGRPWVDKDTAEGGGCS